MPQAIVVHGGAWNIPDEWGDAHREACLAAVDIGMPRFGYLASIAVRSHTTGHTCHSGGKSGVRSAAARRA
jgi:hypothetical protein